MNYGIEHSGDYDIRIDGQYAGSVRRNRATGLYWVCIMTDGQHAPPDGMRIVANRDGSWSWHSAGDATREDAIALAHMACQSLCAQRAA